MSMYEVSYFNVQENLPGWAKAERYDYCEMTDANTQRRSGWKKVMRTFLSVMLVK